MKVSCLLYFLMAGVCASAQMEPSQGSPVSLASLVAEAQQKNPEIQGAIHGGQAAAHAVQQASALPDTQVMVQHLSVGSPRPFAGYTNSDFAYIGLGASQEFPWPGKRALRAQVAGARAEAARVQSGVVSRLVVEQVKMTYFKLAYLQATLAILLRDDKLLNEMEQIAESRYRVGHGNQQEVLKAQLQHTRILQEINMHHREQGELQVQLKRLLGRDQGSADIVTEALHERAIPANAAELLQQARQNNPEINFREQLARRAELQTELARKEFRPDLGLQYMYQNTDRKFRDYYMFTFTVTLPNRGRRQAELAQAQEERDRKSVV